MKKLTNKEKEIMELYWQHGPMFVRELQEHYAEPRPHFNTLSTMVRILERNGFLGHRQFGNSFQYYPLVTEKEYGRSSIAGVIKNYFNDSYLSAVSSFVKEEKISIEELRELIAQIEQSDHE
ncbi:MAG: BlaI/MecI/CopY family transcriptional regulator [Prevotella sp.]|nr:BlaI/MecI/CopY family transcriptional regulator [Prevotella sp.]